MTTATAALHPAFAGLATRCPWYIAGPALGCLIALLLWVANQPLGATGSYVAAMRWARAPRAAPPWRAFFFVGMVAGGLAFSALSGGLPVSWSYPTLDSVLGASWGAKAALLAGAGVFMGYGARTAGGCTSGHGMTGMALASPASVVATMTFMAAAVVTSNVFLLLVGGAR